MSIYPLMLEATAISAIVVGGGAVATRKAKALVGAGANVRVVAPSISSELVELAVSEPRLQLIRARYASSHIDDSMLVIAATDDRDVNARVAADARARGRLVNVANAPDEGNCITPAVHRIGDIVVAVTAGGVPGAAASIRDHLARQLDARYADAVHELATLRRALIDHGQRERWSHAAAALIGENFCECVESGQFVEAIAQWR
jgi:siroheme synthase-like protein